MKINKYINEVANKQNKIDFSVCYKNDTVRSSPRGERNVGWHLFRHLILCVYLLIHCLFHKKTLEFTWNFMSLLK